MSSRFRAGVIGHTGRGDYGHGLDVVFREFPELDVVAVADPDPKGRAEAAGRSGAKRAYADYREMLEQERPQLVAVAPRWLDQRHDMVLACARFGCHVF